MPGMYWSIGSGEVLRVLLRSRNNTGGMDGPIADFVVWDDRFEKEFEQVQDVFELQV